MPETPQELPEDPQETDAEAAAAPAPLPRACAAANAALAALGTLEPTPSAAPFQPLSDGVWISFTEDADTILALHPQAETGGLRLVLDDIGLAGWLSLSYRLDLAEMRGARFLCVLTESRSDGFHSFRPCLRYLLTDGGFHDVFARDYVVSNGGESLQLSAIPIDPDRLAAAHAVEGHLFFQGDAFDVTLNRIENHLV